MEWTDRRMLVMVFVALERCQKLAGEALWLHF